MNATTSQRTIASGIALFLLVLAIACYVLFPVSPPEEPYRMVFTGKTGNVLFDHEAHTASYGLDCAACHHNLEDDDETYDCGECHTAEAAEEEDMLSRTDAIHMQCITCHEDEGAGPVDCTACHAR